MKETIRQRLAKAAKTGKRAVIAIVAAAVLLGSTCYAEAAGIEDVFDEHYYADMYPDLKAAFGYDRASLLRHFKRFGLSEGRVMNEMIDVVKYREMYQDLQDAFGDDWDAYIEHYLVYGAFEHRDSGTGFDPVDYLGRYEDLKEAFGDDILAAYRHYREYGKKEGREARSEAVVRAEQGWAMEYEEEDDDEEPAPTEVPVPTEEPAPTEVPVPTEEPAPTEAPVPTEEPAPTEEPSTPGTEEFVIQSVEVMGSGRIRVTLNRKTEQPLALEAFSIICNSGGSDMTILSVSTEDNMVYDLSTTYYRDQEYDLQITLADGTAISKVFTYRTDCAQIAGINAVRTSATEATITYNSNEPGYFYYVLRENGQSVARAEASLVEVSEAAEPTEADVISEGIKTEMKQHVNAITVTGLSDGMSYTMYYVAVNTEGASTLVHSLSIGSNVHEETAGAIKGAKAFAERLNDSEFLYGFEVELEAATSEALSLEQFHISCPLNETELGEVRTSDNKTYRVYMKRGTIPKGNNTYTILINMKDGTQLKGTCYLDLEAPQVSIWGFEWTDTNTVKVTVDSNEAGYLYYAIQDMVEGEGTIVGKDPSQIYANGTRIEMGYGKNYITVQGVREGQWFCCASEDNMENREDFYTYEKIPPYTAPDPDEDKWPQISSVTVLSDKSLKVVFDKSLDGFYYENNETQISGLSGKPGISKTEGSEGGLENNVLNLSIYNGITIPEGKHTLTIVLYELDEEDYIIETKR